MKKRYIYQIRLLCALFIMALSTNMAFSQVSIVPQFRGGTLVHVDQFFQFFLVNNGPEEVFGSLLMEVKNNSGALLMQIQSDALKLEKGKVLRGNSIRWPGQMQLGSNPAATAFQNRGKLPFGEFVLCYYFRNETQAQNLGEYCSEFQVKIDGLPALVFPRNKDIISMPLPVLQWKAPLSLRGEDVRYNLVLVKKEVHQSAVEAIASNPALLTKNDLKQTFLSYPINAPKLEKEKEYAWQVTAYLGQIEIGKTSIWIFSLADYSKIAAPPPTENYSFPLLDTKIGGAYFITKENKIRFSYQNYHNEDRLKYKIYNVNVPLINVTGLTIISIVPGRNKIEIDGGPINGLIVNQLYVIEVENTIGQKQYLKFKYTY